MPLGASLAQLHIPVGQIDEVTPAVIDSAGEGDVDERAPLGPLRLPEQLHPCLVGKAVSLARVAGNAGTDNIFPSGLSTAVARKDMVDVEIRPVEVNAAILTGVFVALEDVVSRELDFFFWKPVKKTKNDDPGNPDFQRDGLEHSRFGIGDGKMPPTGKIMGQKIARPVGRDNLRMPLVKKRERTPRRTGVDGLPQPVEHENRLVKGCIHDLVVAASGLPSSALRFLSTMEV